MANESSDKWLESELEAADNDLSPPTPEEEKRIQGMAKQLGIEPKLRSDPHRRDEDLSARVQPRYTWTNRQVIALATGLILVMTIPSFVVYHSVSSRSIKNLGEIAMVQKQGLIRIQSNGGDVGPILQDDREMQQAARILFARWPNSRYIFITLGGPWAIEVDDEPLPLRSAHLPRATRTVFPSGGSAQASLDRDLRN